MSDVLHSLHICSSAFSSSAANKSSAKEQATKHKKRYPDLSIPALGANAKTEIQRRRMLRAMSMRTISSEDRGEMENEKVAKRCAKITDGTNAARSSL